MKGQGLLLYLFLTFSLVQSCTPPSCTNHAGDMVEDPNNCHNFYFCVTASQIEGPFNCLAGEHFDPNTADCVPGDQCTNSCVSPCSYECIRAGEDIADRYDCTKHTTCNGANNPGATLTCSPGTYFDGTKCQSDESRCCSCSALCVTGDLDRYIGDPVDCTVYHFCIAVGPPQFTGTCSPPMNFDPAGQECTNYHCVAPCTNVISPNGCIEVFTCEEVGYFPKCTKKCDPHYYYCSISDIGNLMSAKECTGEMVFHPDTHHCVPLNECPYSNHGILTEYFQGP